MDKSAMGEWFTLDQSYFETLATGYRFNLPSYHPQWRFEKQQEEIPSTIEKLRKLELELKVPALKELVELLQNSADFEALTERQIKAVDDYKAIWIPLSHHSYFTKPFSTGKEAAEILWLAKEVSEDERKDILEDLRGLLERLEYWAGGH